MSRRWLFTILTFVIVPSLLLITLEVMVRLINLQEEMMPRYRYSARYGHKLMPLATITHQLPGVWRIIYHTNEHGFRTGMPPSRMYMIDQILSLSVTRIPLVWESLTVRNSARCSTMPLEQKQALSTWACLVGGSQARYEHTMSLVAFFRPEDCHSAV